MPACGMMAENTNRVFGGLWQFGVCFWECLGGQPNSDPTDPLDKGTLRE
jgi:hypothetical protein